MIFKNFPKIPWYDSSLEKIVIEYNDIIAEIELDEKIYKIIFKNYIAINFIGQWDENIIKDIYEDPNNDLIATALAKISLNNNTEFYGGGKRCFDSIWSCIIIKLIDNTMIQIVCDSIEILT